MWNVSWSGYQVNWNNTHLDFFHNTIWNAERAMDSWVNGYTQENNKVYNNFANAGDWFSETSTDFDIQDNLITSASPFEDAENQNFMPKAGSGVVDNGMVISGFEKPYKGSAPDIGAYERFGTKWTAGVGAIEDTGEGQELSVFDIQFTIIATTETCPNQDNGTISIEADIEKDYTVSFNETDTDFTKEFTIEGIAPGNYELCISFKGGTESQCFNILIKEADEIAGKSSVANRTLSVNMAKGTAPFIVLINNETLLETEANSFDVKVNQGDQVKIKSSKDCEGEITKIIDFYDNIIAYPNATSGDFKLLMPINEGNVLIIINDVYGRLLSSKFHEIIKGKINLSLSSKPSGVYFIKVMIEEPVSIKVIKK